MDEITEDIENIEKDIKQIRCNPILECLKHTIKCITDSISYIFRVKK